MVRKFNLECWERTSRARARYLFSGSFQTSILARFSLGTKSYVKSLSGSLDSRSVSRSVSRPMSKRSRHDNIPVISFRRRQEQQHVYWNSHSVPSHFVDSIFHSKLIDNLVLPVICRPTALRLPSTSTSIRPLFNPLIFL